MAEIISGIYKITNTITGDFYIGSSNNVKHRWAAHKWPSTWSKYPNKQMYLDMKKYGIDKFVFEILAEVEIEQLKETEQKFIETLKPTYNNYNAKGHDIERYKEYQKEYNKSDKHKESKKKYRQSKKGKETQRKYEKSTKRKESNRKSSKKYNNQICYFNGQTLTLNALRKRFQKKGISNPTAEAKKYLLQ